MANKFKIKYKIPACLEPTIYPIEKISFDCDSSGPDGNYVVLHWASSEFGKKAHLCNSGGQQLFTPDQLRDMAQGFITMADSLDKYYEDVKNTNHNKFKRGDKVIINYDANCESVLLGEYLNQDEYYRSLHNVWIPSLKKSYMRNTNEIKKLL